MHLLIRPLRFCLAMAFVFVTGTAVANNVRIEEQVDGVRFVALPKNPKKSYDTRLLKGAESL